MQVYSEVSLKEFKFWSYAQEFAQELTTDELDHMEFMLEEMYPDGVSATTINDIFWHDKDWVCRMLNYEDYEDFLRHRVK